MKSSWHAAVGLVNALKDALYGCLHGRHSNVTLTGEAAAMVAQSQRQLLEGMDRGVQFDSFRNLEKPGMLALGIAELHESGDLWVQSL